MAAGFFRSIGTRTLLDRLAARRRGPIGVLVVDDDPLFATTLSVILGADERIQVLGDVGDGLAALEEAYRRRPDVVLMDLQMPRMDGVEATRRLRAMLPHTPVVVVTSCEDPDVIQRALDAGAARFLTKREPPEALREAVLDAASRAIPLRRAAEATARRPSACVA